MKQKLIGVILVLILGIGSNSFSAASPLVDVPAKHWAYKSVAKLVDAGIVEGYEDSTFRGDKAITRFEMAVIVANAMANQEKATVAERAEIAKLQAEFSDELNQIGVRVQTLENKVGNIKFTGEFRERYEWTKNPNPSWPNPAEKTRLRLGIAAQLTDDLSFVGRYQAESADSGAPADTQLTLAYLTGKAFGDGTVAFGRVPVFLGKGLMYDGEGMDCIQDGITVSFGNEVKFTGTAFKAGGSYNPLSGTNILAANVDWMVNKDFDFMVEYVKSKGNTNTPLDTWTAGFGYNAIANTAFTFEYGKNSADVAKNANGGHTPKAYLAKAKYLGADPAKLHSYGLWVGYRKADTGFFNNTTLDGTDAQQVGYLSDVKGFEYGLEYTAFPNSLFTLQYNSLKDNATGNVNGDNVVAQLFYFF